jgi:chromosome segregation ATPase
MSDTPSSVADAVPDAGVASTDTATETVGRLTADLHDLQVRYDELLRRFLSQTERAQALDKALYAERLKSAGLQRDLGVFQRQWQIAQKEWHFTQTQWRAAEAHWLARQAQIDQLKATCAELEQSLQKIRRSRVWQLAQGYWRATSKLKGR